ncbi:hypothetical protein [Streptomyces sp. LARHCF252]
MTFSKARQCALMSALPGSAGAKWPDEIRSPEEMPPPVELSDEEIDGALALLDSLTREDLEAAGQEDIRAPAAQHWLCR